MHWSLLSLTATVLLHGVSCHLFPQAVLNQLVTNVELPKQYKRQTTNELVVCVSDKLDAAFHGNTSRFVSECKFAATFLDTSNLTSLITSIFRTFCVRDCGDVVLDAYNDCGVFDVGFRGTEELIVGLCGTNGNGDLCYTLYSEGVTLINTESSCYGSYISSGVCSCRSDLSDAVDEQGCCVDIYHDFIAGLGTYDPDRLYDDCNVNSPPSCNNSPLTASDSLSQVSYVSTFAIISALICYAVVG